MHKSVKRELAISKMIVDPALQRGLDWRRVNKMAAELDRDAVGTLVVSERPTGFFHIIDGQHRTEALRIAEGDDAKVDCRVFLGLTREDEARLFRLYNNTAKLQAITKFLVRIEEQEPTALAINDLLHKYGWKVVPGSGDGQFAAVAAIEKIWNRDHRAVERSLATITKAWGHSSAAVNGTLFEGIGLVYARYSEDIIDKSLVERLSLFEGGPDGFLGKARGLHAAYNKNLPNAVADLVVETYNKNKRSKALPPWRTR
jgi:hypothetical protein